MNMLYYICIGASAGVLLGFALGGIKSVLQRKPYPDKKVEATYKLINWIGNTLKYITFILLLLGFIWCVYFLILAIAIPEQADYANNIAELIVAVLTTISILFAFIEFLRRKDNNK